ncbi:protein kinase C zeta type-like [Rhinophrynus dorsalis]
MKGHTCIFCDVVVHKTCCTLVSHCVEDLKNVQKSVEAGCVPAPTPSVDLQKNQIQDYSFIKVLGKGGFGKVFLVQEKKQQCNNRMIADALRQINGQFFKRKQEKKEYALKVVKKPRIRKDIDSIWTERSILCQASDCPFLVALKSCFQTPSRLCFLMEYASGGSLYDRLKRHGKLPESHVRFYAAELCLGINFLHQRSIIHRDVKLQNILLDAQGHIKITDFGMSKEFFLESEGTRTKCGTPTYYAPEIILEKEYGFGVDWWALGILLFRLATAQHPFAKDKEERITLLSNVIERPAKIPPFISEDLYMLLKAFLRKDPTKRLGCWPKPGFLFIKLQSFFDGLDWEMAEKKMIPPPFKPYSDEDLIEYLDVELTPMNQKELQQIDQGQFAGFYYLSPE